jgi:hypothetical protein
VFYVLDTGFVGFRVVSCAISLFCTWKDEVDGFCSVCAIILSLCYQFLFSLCYQFVSFCYQFVHGRMLFVYVVDDVVHISTGRLLD